MRRPMQPFVRDRDDTVRFRPNGIVAYLLDHGGIDLNKLAALEFSQADREQFAQLIGYSLAGYHELSYVSDESALAASDAARSQLGDESIGGCRDRGCEIHCGVLQDTPMDPPPGAPSGPLVKHLLWAQRLRELADSPWFAAVRPDEDRQMLRNIAALLNEPRYVED